MKAEEKDPKIFITHILESITEIENHLKGISEDKFFNDIKTQDAVFRRIEIIGEAVKNLPKFFRNRYSDIPWKKMAGMRDVFIHKYFGVDINLVWKIVKNDIPKLKKQILELLEKF
jgi:uncharacterized protein with HEPN domain